VTLRERGTIGPWLLGRELGKGGNAIVFEATSDDFPDPVALKVLKSSKPDREPYRRFVAEVATLRDLGDFDGILPLIAAGLPDAPTAGDRPWLAMPIAQGIRGALSGTSLNAVIEAMADVAETLSRLEAEHGIAHRDLKPANLYGTNGKALVGDFGLVAVPDAEELTREDRPLGPVHYMPYEMLSDPAHADPFSADVYALAKTAWVLASEQSYPVEGHQPAVSRGYSLVELRPHPKAAALDRLIDRATRLDPTDRPTMAEMATELRGLSEFPDGSIAFDPGEVGTEIRHRLSEELAGEDQRRNLLDAFAASINTVRELTAPINEGLLSAHPGAEIEGSPDELTRNILLIQEMGRSELIKTWHRTTRLGIGPHYHRYELRIARALGLDEDGGLTHAAFVDVGDPETSRTDFMWGPEERSAQVGTVEADAMLRAATEDIGRKAAEALEVFRNALPSVDD
jgi:serine/threonine protein kinase